MAEENPHIEVKIHSLPILNSRQQYLHEDTALFLGPIQQQKKNWKC